MNHPELSWYSKVAEKAKGQFLNKILKHPSPVLTERWI
jgi:hypothetical protein